MDTNSWMSQWTTTTTVINDFNKMNKKYPPVKQPRKRKANLKPITAICNACGARDVISYDEFVRKYNIKPPSNSHAIDSCDECKKFNPHPEREEI